MATYTFVLVHKGEESLACNLPFLLRNILQTHLHLLGIEGTKSEGDRVLVSLSKYQQQLEKRGETRSGRATGSVQVSEHRRVMYVFFL